MANYKNLGEFETLVLMALVRLGDDAYGVTIRQEIETRAKRDAPIGSVYATLERLEEKKLISSRLGEATAIRGGRRKKYFAITARGEKTLQATLSGLGRMVKGTPYTKIFPAGVKFMQVGSAK